MSSGNWELEKKRNYELKKKRVSAAYTIKTGLSSHNGILDNPVCVYNPADDIAITLPDGSYIGQEVLVVVEANTSDKDATLTVTTSANASEDVITLEAAGEYIKLLWNGTDWDVVYYEGCSLA
jgi:hypothetical protein